MTEQQVAAQQALGNTDRSIGELVASVREDAMTLVKGEVELAKAEAKMSAQRAGKGAGMIAGAAFLAITGWFLLNVAASWLLAEWLPTWAGFAIVMLVNFLVAGVLALLAKREFDRVKGLEATQQSVATTAEQLKGAIKPAA